MTRREHHDAPDMYRHAAAVSATADPGFDRAGERLPAILKFWACLGAVTVVGVLTGWLDTDTTIRGLQIAAAASLIVGVLPLLPNLAAIYTPPPILLWLAHALNFIHPSALTPGWIGWPAAGLERPPRALRAA